MLEISPSFKAAIIFLQICGCNPFKQNWLSKVLQAVTVLSSFMIVLLMTLEIILNWKGVATMAKLNLYSLAISILVKSSSLIRNNALLREILNSIDNLFPLNKYGLDLKNKLLKYDNLVLIFIKVYFWLAIVAGGQFLATPVFTDEKGVPFGGYDLCDINISKCFSVNLIWQIFYMYNQVIAISIGYDSLFAFLICRGYNAIHLLKYGFRSLKITRRNDKIITEELIKLVNQHNVILLYIKQFKQFLSGVLLVQFWTSLGGLILIMYMILSQGSSINPNDFIRFSMAYVLFFGQLFVYCLGGTILIEQLNTISYEIFALDWYLQTKIRKKLTFVIARCNYGDNLKAGKMVDLNLISFVNVLKNATSICMLLLKVGTQEHKQ